MPNLTLLPLLTLPNPNHDLTFLSSTFPLQSLWPYLFSLLLPILLLPLLKAPPSYAPPGCRKLGIPRSKSNLNDEFAPEYAHASPADKDGRPSCRIKALFTYPIKSCAGVELDTAEVVETGLKYDRMFCFAEFVERSPQPSRATAAATETAPPTTTKPKQEKEKEGDWIARTLRNRTFNTLALLQPEIWIPDSSSPTYSPSLPEVKSQGALVITYPRVQPSLLTKLLIALHLLPSRLSFSIPLSPTAQKSQSYPLTPVQIWKDSPLAYNYGTHIPSSLWTFLSSGSEKLTDPHKKRTISLFRSHPTHNREIFRSAPRKAELGFQPVTGFADAYPLHLLNLASVRDVGERCKRDIDRLSVRRFRANVVVTGPGRFEEDAWKRIFVHQDRWRGSGSSSGVGGEDLSLKNRYENGDEEDNGEGNGVEIHTVCRTIRCRLPNVDPDTGDRHRSEPDRTLKSYRRIDPGDLTNACLGMQLVPGVREFTLRVNDPISVLETGEHCYIKMLAPGEKVEGV
ncbi:hypothetical protein BO70DRAFT_366597 [Aspergillus heteromorphus CBS 117.55]|uniref:MOSC domain-containing protein n=1 Tax=Aspergillus heteromorphus CBS 117.55 TaxID=1448321 RepID=A0A317UWB1_9EURO|nr:uncharacterized protein BO70DRAFT_366597 [Aspergillus heteromorphus CBS 117.55]PWY65965.1 hypothetical protein BO70DRAFT_366597 [Aspergillus heteromorphus CBS 117.55]